MARSWSLFQQLGSGGVGGRRPSVRMNFARSVIGAGRETDMCPGLMMVAKSLAPGREEVDRRLVRARLVFVLGVSFSLDRVYGVLTRGLVFEPEGRAGVLCISGTNEDWAVV